jgi:hypothetical protein
MDTDGALRAEAERLVRTVEAVVPVLAARRRGWLVRLIIVLSGVVL